jgi:drug/metabolite transporter (DMT)-like permease
MRLLDTVFLVLYAFSLTAGNVLFKLAAGQARLATKEAFVVSLVTNGYFITGVLIYGFLAFFWVWILTRVPLSVAYLFVFTTFVFVPALSFFIFGEKINAWYLLGAALVACGLGIIVFKSA